MIIIFMLLNNILLNSNKKEDINIFNKIEEEKKINKEDNNINFEVNINNTQKLKLIELYSKKKSFYFLISLFVQIYNNKDLCPLLMGKFHEMNINKNEKSNDNMDRGINLEVYTTNFVNIVSEADKLIKNNDYNAIQFYGIILIYLNYYDYDNFTKYIDLLFKEKMEILFNILLLYSSHFIKPINQNLELFSKLIDFAISNKEFSFFENGINLIKNIEIFIAIIDKLKEKIFNKYVNHNKNEIIPINIKEDLKYEIKKIDEYIISKLESIIDFCIEKNVLLVYFNINFWKNINILKYCDEPKIENINICYKLREIFIKYNNLITNIFKDDKNGDIKTDIINYFKIDEFAFLLDKNIRKFFELNKKNMHNEEFLEYLSKFNPYYKEEQYSCKRELYIFDYINFDKINDPFIKAFRNLEYVNIFKDNLTQFLNKIISKINNISIFGAILELIDIKYIPKLEIDQYYNQLKDKYEQVIKKQIESLNGEQFNEGIKIIAKFIDLIFIHEKSCNFIVEKIDKLDKKIIPFIYNELIIRCKDDEYKIMEEFIYNKFLNESYNINNLIYLIDCLKKDDKKIVLNKIIKKCEFTKEEFYSNNKNNKILLLCELFEKGRIEYNDIKNSNLEIILKEIIKDIDERNINIRKLEEFLDNKKKEEAIRKLELITNILNDYCYDCIEKYEELKSQLYKNKENIAVLLYIKNSLSIFFHANYRHSIEQILKIIRRLENGTMHELLIIKGEIDNLFNEYKPLADEINKVKDFLFFKVIYNNTQIKDEEERFRKALCYLGDIKRLFYDKHTMNEIYENK